MKALLVALFVGSFTISHSLANPVHWTGDGDGVSWGDRFNWSEANIPDETSEVFIGSTVDDAPVEMKGTGPVVARSIESDALLKIVDASLTLTGTSNLRKGLTFDGGSLTVTGEDAMLEVLGPTELSGAAITSSGGARIDFVDLESHTLEDDRNSDWRSIGEGSELNCLNMRWILINSRPEGSLSVEALDGGSVLFPNLTSIAYTVVEFPEPTGGVKLVAGNASVVSLPVLNNFQDSGSLPKSLIKAVGTGIVEAPGLLTLNGVNIDLNAASHPERFTSLVNADFFQINKGIVNMEKLAIISGVRSVVAHGGAKLEFSNVSKFIVPTFVDIEWKAQDPGSELKFSKLTTMHASPSNNHHFITASAGGHVLFPELTTITLNEADPYTTSSTHFLAEKEAFISAPLLQTFENIIKSYSPRSSLKAVETGVISVPQLLAPIGVNLDLNAASNPQQFTSLPGGHFFFINNGNVTLDRFTSLNELASLGVYNGAKVNVTNISTYTQKYESVAAWNAIDPGSELNFLDLKTITGAPNPTARFEVNANEGGTVTFPALISITQPDDGDMHHNSGISVNAINGGQVSAPALVEFNDLNQFPNSRLYTFESGILEVDRLASLEGVDWDVRRRYVVDEGRSLSSHGNFHNGFINYGTVETKVPGTELNVGGAIIGTGNVRVVNGATLSLRGPLTVDGSGLLSLGPMSTINLVGSLTGTTTRTGIADFPGTLLLSGNQTANPQEIEVMSRDLGPTVEGFQNNNVYGTMRLQNETIVRLVDKHRNTTSDERECLYVDSLVVPAPCVLSLGGLKLYARHVQITGSVTQGTVIQMPDSGPLKINHPTPGTISEVGELDEWIFFGRSGTGVSIVIDTEDSTLSAPQLAAAEVVLLNSQGEELASIATTEGNERVLTIDAMLQEDGIYRVQVRADRAIPQRTGSYRIIIWDTSPDVTPLVLNETLSGTIEIPTNSDTWSFPANGGQEIQFDLINKESGDINFALKGPEGWVGFNGLTADSDLLTLPSDGVYTLTVTGTEHSWDLAYAFRVIDTTESDLPLATPVVGTVRGMGQVSLFRIVTDTTGVLDLSLKNDGLGNRLSMFVSKGTAPTRDTYEYASASGPGANRRLIIPSASDGEWYVLVHADEVIEPGEFTLTATMPNIALTALIPERHAGDHPFSLVIAGAGFDLDMGVELVSGNGVAIAADEVMLDSSTQITAHFSGDAIPLGTYTLRVVPTDGEVILLADAFESLPPGEGRLETQIILPSSLTPNSTAILYVEYVNTGSSTMPAPELVLKSADSDSDEFPILSLDRSPTPGTTDSQVAILASGVQTDVLHPGERRQVPIHYLGLLEPWDSEDDVIELAIQSADHVRDIATTRITTGLSPNRKTGPGVGEDGWIKENALLPYRIQFENIGLGSLNSAGEAFEAYAKGPVRRVSIADQLQEELDWETFQLTELAFGDVVVSIPSGSSHFKGSVAMTDGDVGFIVEIEAGIEFSSGRVFANFRSIDQETALPTGILTGFLPPEDGSGRGMGHLSYTVRAKAGLPANLEIRNVAHIAFDELDTITTDQIHPQDPFQGIDSARQTRLTLDTHAPMSTIGVLPSETTSGEIPVEWSGSDVGAGVATYDIYVSTDGEPWDLWLGSVSTTSGTFIGEAGHTYGFLSVARDSVGNVQEMAANAQSTTHVLRTWKPEISLSAHRSADGTKSITLNFNVDPNYEYRVDYREELEADETWKPLPDAPHNGGSVTDEAVPSHRFYRLARTRP